MSNPLKVALVGLQGINEWFYAPALLRSSKATLVAGIDPAEEARAKFAARGAAPAYASLAEAMHRHSLDAVIIGSPNHIHRRNVEEAAAAGLHMCVTKPLANNSADSQAAITAAKRANVVLQVGQEFRLRPGIRRAIEFAHQRTFGNVSLAVAHMGHTGGLNPKLTGPATWRNNPANCPGGCANMLGIHLIDACNALFGEPLRVTASLRHLYGSASMEDTASVTIEYERGTAICTSSYVSPKNETMRLYAIDANMVAGERELIVEKAEGRSTTDLAAAPSSADVLIDQLHDAVRLGTPPETGGHEGLLAVAVLEAAIRSAEQGRTVEMREIEEQLCHEGPAAGR